MVNGATNQFDGERVAMNGRTGGHSKWWFWWNEWCSPSCMVTTKIVPGKLGVSCKDCKIVYFVKYCYYHRGDSYFKEFPLPLKYLLCICVNGNNDED